MARLALAERSPDAIRESRFPGLHPGYTTEHIPRRSGFSREAFSRLKPLLQVATHLGYRTQA